MQSRSTRPYLGVHIGKACTGDDTHIRTRTHNSVVRGHIVVPDDVVEERLHALILEGSAHADRHEGLRERAGRMSLPT